MITWTVRRDCRGKAGNMREHHFAKARRYKSERGATEGCALVQLRPEGLLALAALPRPVVVTLTRTGKRLLDDDNLPAACAAVRDQVAVMLGVTDGPADTRVSWVCKQEKSPDYSVRVEIRSAEVAS